MQQSITPSQSTLIELSKNNLSDGRVAIRVHFLDNSSKVFLINQSITIDILIPNILNKLGISTLNDDDHDDNNDYDDIKNNGNINPNIIIKANNLASYFGIYESKDGLTIDCCFDRDERIIDIIDSWGGPPKCNSFKFIFMIRLFVSSVSGLEYKDDVYRRLQQSSDHSSRTIFKGHYTEGSLSLSEYLSHANLKDTNLLHLQYIQVIHHIITDVYPTSSTEALSLGALHFLSKFGQFNKDTHIPGFIGRRIVEYIPLNHLHKKSLLVWEQSLFREVSELLQSSPFMNVMSSSSSNSSSATDDERKANNSNNNNNNCSSSNIERIQQLAQLQYLRTIYASPYYGITTFNCQLSSTSSSLATRLLPLTAPTNDLLMGLQESHVYLFTPRFQLLKKFHFDEIIRWGYQLKELFFMEINSEADNNNKYGIVNDNNQHNHHNSLNFTTNGVSWRGTIELTTSEGKFLCDLLTDYAKAYVYEQDEEEKRQKHVDDAKKNNNSKIKDAVAAESAVVGAESERDDAVIKVVVEDVEVGISSHEVEEEQTSSTTATVVATTTISTPASATTSTTINTSPSSSSAEPGVAAVPFQPRMLGQLKGANVSHSQSFSLSKIFDNVEGGGGGGHTSHINGGCETQNGDSSNNNTRGSIDKASSSSSQHASPIRSSPSKFNLNLNAIASTFFSTTSSSSSSSSSTGASSPQKPSITTTTSTSAATNNNTTIVSSASSSGASAVPPLYEVRPDSNRATGVSIGSAANVGYKNAAGNRQSMSVLTRLRLTAVAEADSDTDECNNIARSVTTGRIASCSGTGRVVSSSATTTTTTLSGKRRYIYKTDPSNSKSSKSIGNGSSSSTKSAPNTGRLIINNDNDDDATAATMLLKKYSNNNSNSSSNNYNPPAIKIQSVYRGYVARCAVGIMIEDMIDSGQLVL